MALSPTIGCWQKGTCVQLCFISVMCWLVAGSQIPSLCCRINLRGRMLSCLSNLTFSRCSPWTRDGPASHASRRAEPPAEGSSVSCICWVHTDSVALGWVAVVSGLTLPSAPRTLLHFLIIFPAPSCTHSVSLPFIVTIELKWGAQKKRECLCTQPASSG